MPSLLMTRMPTFADCTLVSHMDILTRPTRREHTGQMGRPLGPSSASFQTYELARYTVDVRLPEDGVSHDTGLEEEGRAEHEALEATPDAAGQHLCRHLGHLLLLHQRHELPQGEGVGTAEHRLGHNIKKTKGTSVTCGGQSGWHSGVPFLAQSYPFGDRLDGAPWEEAVIDPRNAFGSGDVLQYDM